jgi:PAS domain S-box-containing protein
MHASDPGRQPTRVPTPRRRMLVPAPGGRKRRREPCKPGRALGSFGRMDGRSESELQRYLRCQRELVAQLVDGDSLEQVAPGFLAILGELLEWEAGALWEIPDGSSSLRFVRGWSVPDLDAEPLWELSRELAFERGTGLIGRAWESGEVAWTRREPPGSSYPRGPLALRLGLRAGLALPVPAGAEEETLAIVEFHSASKDADADRALALTASFTEQLAAFVRRRREEARIRYERADAERARQHLAEVVRGTQDAVLSKDLDGILTTWNPAAERLYGYAAEEAIGRHVSFLVPEDHKNEEEMILDRVRRGEGLKTYETERIRADGARISVSLTVSPITVSQGGLIGASVIARDITSERRRGQAREFLLAASRLLDSSLDPDQTARTIVGTIVPELAEICVIDFLREDGWLGDSVVAGTDEEAAARLEQIRREHPLDPAGSHPVAQVLREGRAMVWRDLTAPDVVDEVAQSDAHRQLISDAGYRSAAVVGLLARGRTIGTLSFLHAHSDLRYDPADLEFLGELADRAALVLDNARLYHERDQIAQNLQRGLRPPGPEEVPGLEISVVFEPVGDGVEIGGDVYDVLPTEDGCWILIGDVAGKGSGAAGVSVALRHSVRGLTREIDEPDEVLRHVNGLLLAGSGLNDFATAILARLRRRGDGWRLALASAGHPPALHVGASHMRQLGGGAVLGAWADLEVGRHDLALAPEETLLLYTDGWLEAGPASAHADPEAMGRLTRSLAGSPPEELTRRLRDDALARGSGELRDDMVVLALRPCAVPSQALIPAAP